MTLTFRTLRGVILASALLWTVADAPSALGQTASQYFPINPCRLYDSRQPQPGNPLTGNQQPGRQINVKGTCTIPNDAKAISYNVTIVSPSAPGFLTLYPAGGSLPQVSALNFVAGEVRGNGGVVPVAVGSPDLNIYLATSPPGGSAHVVLDATGYFK